MQSPEGKFYYFKRSQYKNPTDTKPGKDFTFEFWNEVIAFELCTMLGFNMLRYDVAIYGDVMGCINESMINSGEKDEDFNKQSSFKKWILRAVKKTLNNSEKKYEKQNLPLPKIYYDTVINFAPIYDSGSSLGRS